MHIGASSRGCPLHVCAVGLDRRSGSRSPCAIILMGGGAWSMPAMLALTINLLISVFFTANALRGGHLAPCPAGSKLARWRSGFRKGLQLAGAPKTCNAALTAGLI